MLDKKLIPDSTNLILNKYNSTSSNHVICIDETSLGSYGTLFLAIDLASRCIICHCYHSEALDTNSVIKTLSEAFRKRSFMPSVLIVHSDRGSLFKNDSFSSFLKEKGVAHSRGSSAAHQNQVIERLNRTLKDILKTFLDKNWRIMKNNPLAERRFSISDFVPLVIRSIETYNNRPHRSLNKSTPNEMEEALFKEHQDKHPNALILYDSKAVEYQDFQLKVLSEYQGDWQRFFIEWQEESRQNQKQLLTKLEEKALEAKAQAKAQANEARVQYESLYAKYFQIQKDLEKVLAESLIAKEDRDAKANRKNAYKSRKKKPLREVITLKDLDLILDHVNGRSQLQKSRRRLGLILLYFTGLRVSNLRLLSIQNTQDLFTYGKIKLSLIKGGASRYDLVVSSKDRKRLVNNHQIDLDILSSCKKGSDPLLTNKEGFSLSREYLDKELNFILQKASLLLNKHLRTHSFRASYVTDFLEVHDLHEVQELIGHKSIASTLEYKRSRLSITDRFRLLKDRPNNSKEVVPIDN
jgi:site-specific recombinase XerD